MDITKKTKIHWILHSPSPYNADLFREIHVVREIDFNVYFHHLNSKTHFWKSDLATGYNSRKLNSVFWDPLMKIALRKSNENKPEVFLIAGWDNIFNITFILLLILRNKRYVMLSDTPNLSRKINFFKSKVRGLLLNFFFRHSYKILTTGQPAIEAFVKLGANRSKIVNFPYWINLERYTAYRASRPLKKAFQAKSHVIFVSSGRIINQLKGYDISLRALAIVNQNLPASCDFEYRVIGDGPDIKQLHQLAGQLGLADKIKFLGWLESSEVISELAHAHCCIHSSPVHEPYGVVVIEAMAVGLVVFASDSTIAAIDRIRTGENGFIHPSKNYEFLAKQILDLLENTNRIKEIGECAYQTSVQWPMSLGVNIVKSITEL